MKIGFISSSLITAAIIAHGCGTSKPSDMQNTRFPNSVADVAAPDRECLGEKSDPEPPTAGCMNNCGKKSTNGCWCDILCKKYSDCCSDYDEYCPSPTPSPAPEKTCLEHCGKKSPGGCWCDKPCKQYNDCCPDYDKICADPTPTPAPSPDPTPGPTPQPACKEILDCPALICNGVLVAQKCTNGQCSVPHCSPNGGCQTDEDCPKAICEGDPDIIVNQPCDAQVKSCMPPPCPTDNTCNTDADCPKLICGDALVDRKCIDNQCSNTTCP